MSLFNNYDSLHTLALFYSWILISVLFTCSVLSFMNTILSYFKIETLTNMSKKNTAKVIEYIGGGDLFGNSKAFWKEILLQQGVFLGIIFAIPNMLGNDLSYGMTLLSLIMICSYCLYVVVLFMKKNVLINNTI